MMPRELATRAVELITSCILTYAPSLKATANDATYDYSNVEIGDRTKLHYIEGFEAIFLVITQ